MNRTLPVLILRALASVVTLAGLRFFKACAERLAPAAQPDPADLDAEEKEMLSRPVGALFHLMSHDVRGPVYACGISLEEKTRRDDMSTGSPARTTCPDCLRAHYASAGEQQS